VKVVHLPLGDPRWSEFTSSNADATPFHLPAWAKLIADCYRFEAFVLAVVSADGEILAGAPTTAVRSPLGRSRWVSLPFSDSCPLLVRPGVPVEDAVALLRDHALASGASELEVRGPLPLSAGRFPVEAGYNYLLQLPSDPSALHPSKGHRQNRNQAERRGVRIRHGSSAEDVAAFYRLHTLTRRRQGVPVQPRRFFDLIGQRLLERGHGFVSTATLDGDVVAAGLFLTHNGTLAAKFRASDPARQDTGAGFLVDWESMVTACAEGYHTLDLGRTDHGEDGQRRYKTGWGASEEPLVYTHLSDDAPNASRLHGGGLSRRIVRRSPLWAVRMIGEVLYRWTA
jgi:CelD/BcsL family acetyltransferase involved in cellulose biosynthesis